MIEQWFLAKNKERLGPYSLPQLKRMVANNQIKKSDMLLKVGEKKWQTAENVTDLFNEKLAVLELKSFRDKRVLVSSIGLLILCLCTLSIYTIRLIRDKNNLADKEKNYILKNELIAEKKHSDIFDQSINNKNEVSLIKKNQGTVLIEKSHVKEDLRKNIEKKNKFENNEEAKDKKNKIPSAKIIHELNSKDEHLLKDVSSKVGNKKDKLEKESEEKTSLQEMIKAFNDNLSDSFELDINSKKNLKIIFKSLYGTGQQVEALSFFNVYEKYFVNDQDFSIKQFLESLRFNGQDFDKGLSGFNKNGGGQFGGGQFGGGGFGQKGGFGQGKGGEGFGGPNLGFVNGNFGENKQNITEEEFKKLRPPEIVNCKLINKKNIEVNNSLNFKSRFFKTALGEKIEPIGETGKEEMSQKDVMELGFRNAIIAGGIGAIGGNGGSGGVRYYSDLHVLDGWTIKETLEMVNEKESKYVEIITFQEKPSYQVSPIISIEWSFEKTKGAWAIIRTIENKDADLNRRESYKIEPIHKNIKEKIISAKLKEGFINLRFNDYLKKLEIATDNEILAAEEFLKNNNTSEAEKSFRKILLSFLKTGRPVSQRSKILDVLIKISESNDKNINIKETLKVYVDLMKLGFLKDITSSKFSSDFAGAEKSGISNDKTIEEVWGDKNLEVDSVVFLLSITKTIIESMFEIGDIYRAVELSFLLLENKDISKTDKHQILNRIHDFLSFIDPSNVVGIQILEKLIDLDILTFGKDSIEVAKRKHIFGLLILNSENLTGSRSMFNNRPDNLNKAEISLKDAIRFYGKDEKNSTILANAKMYLAYTLVLMGKKEECVNVVNEAKDLLSVPGNISGQIGLNLFSVFQKTSKILQNDLLEKESRLGAIKYAEVFYGKTSFQYVYELKNLAMFYVCQGGYLKSLPLLTELFDICENKKVPDSIKYDNIFLLGANYFALHLSKKAISVLIKANGLGGVADGSPRKNSYQDVLNVTRLAKAYIFSNQIFEGEKLLGSLADFLVFVKSQKGSAGEYNPKFVYAHIECLKVYYYLNEAKGSLSIAESYLKQMSVEAKKLGKGNPISLQVMMLESEFLFLNGKAEKGYELANYCLREVSKFLDNKKKYDYAMSDRQGEDTVFFGGLQVNEEMRSKCKYLVSVYEGKILFANDSIKTLSEVLSYFRDNHGLDSFEVGNCLRELSVCYFRKRFFEKAEIDCISALKIFETKSESYFARISETLAVLGDIKLGNNHFDEAEILFLKSVSIKKQVFNEDHSKFSPLYAKLGYISFVKNIDNKAEEYFLKAIAGVKGDNYVSKDDIIGYYSSLTKVLISNGKLDIAMTYLLENYKIALGFFGEKHIQTAFTKAELSYGFFKKNEFLKSKNLCVEALNVLLENQTLLFVGFSEIEQLNFINKYKFIIDILASFSDSPDLYRYINLWKGVVYSRQNFIRSLQNVDVAMRKKLYDASRDLSVLVNQTPDIADLSDHAVKLDRVRNDKIKLEKQLSVNIPNFNFNVNLTDLQSNIKDGEVIVDFFFYLKPAESLNTNYQNLSEAHYSAWIIQKEKPIIKVDLGPSSDIDKNINLWRSSVSTRKLPSEGPQDPALVLREKVWLPIAKHLKGSKTVIISPDGLLGTLPFSALPGEDIKKYLIEERNIAVVPFLQTLPDLLTKKESTGIASMLALGDVAYDVEATSQSNTSGLLAVRGGKGAKWNRLPGTKAEVLSIENSFKKYFPSGSLVELNQNKASEQSVRESAPKSKYLHFATHGFFADESIKAMAAKQDNNKRMMGEKAVVTGENPGLLSGLVLAGANLPPKGNGDDGILTASEVVELDLTGVELAILSACETGLGKTAGGEGIFGLQRAFQLAGARTVVASSWKVPDLSTKELMVRFYGNLWEKKMGKLEALREAQLWVMKEGKATGLDRGIDDESVVVKETKKEPMKAESSTKGEMLPPKYWAAWILSGAWN